MEISRRATAQFRLRIGRIHSEASHHADCLRQFECDIHPHAEHEERRIHIPQPIQKRSLGVKIGRMKTLQVRRSIRNHGI